MGPNDHTVFEGKGEQKSAPKTGNSFGQQLRPNAHTVWATGKEPAQGQRAVDAAQGQGELLSCEKCSFKTRLEEDFKFHTKKVGGLMKCERQRQNFGAMKECSACSGLGETSTGICKTCSGMGKILDKSAGAPVDVAEIAKTTAEAVVGALAPSLNAIAEGLKALASSKVTSAAKEKKPRKGKARGSSRVDRRGTPAAGPAPVAPVESEAQPLADPQDGSETPE